MKNWIYEILGSEKNFSEYIFEISDTGYPKLPIQILDIRKFWISEIANTNTRLSQNANPSLQIICSFLDYPCFLNLIFFASIAFCHQYRYMLTLRLSFYRCGIGFVHPTLTLNAIFWFAYGLFTMDMLLWTYVLRIISLYICCYTESS